MNSCERQSILTLVRSAILGEKLPLPNNFNIDFALQIAKKHQIYGLIYYGAFNCGIDKTLPQMKDLFISVYKNLVISEGQAYEINKLVKAFDENKIDYMLLKGILLKDMYPKKEFRAMGDADILIKTGQYSKIKPIMRKLGFEMQTESDHELIWRKPQLLLELHKRLIPSYNKDYFAYFGDGWRLATIKNGTQYSMTNEDNMIYLFTHFAKHYRDAGVGIRHMVDLWVFRQKNPNINEEYIKKELMALRLYDFYLNIIDTLEVWFNFRDPNEKTDFITAFIFNSGVYGTKEVKALSSSVKISKSTKNIKFKKFFNLIFLPYNYMCQKHRFLKYLPFLLPIMWIVRIWNVLIFKTSRIKTYKNRIDFSTKEKINDYQLALNFVGLDFNFK